VNNSGVLKFLVVKKLTEELKMLLTGHVNLNKLNNTNIKDFGIKLEYE